MTYPLSLGTEMQNAKSEKTGNDLEPRIAKLPLSTADL